MKVIILAGGFGTRLQSLVKDVPKPMAKIGKKPFLEYIFTKLSSFEIDEVVLSVGYKQKIIKEYFKNKYKNIKITYSSETTPLGTGGAIKKALKLLPTDENILILNGDTFFNLKIDAFFDFSTNSLITIAIKPMQNFERYGSVIVHHNRVLSFEEKVFTKKGFINTGVYSISPKIFEQHTQNIFSFEDFLNEQKNIKAYTANSYFVDIGIPKDYIKAQTDFKELF
ncbi:nucleotidyltransferase family protein [Sulfurimonas sp. SWIR-19]|uniref:nucleotidyltransferase family protein n=1 Tax=Sulfurimonas sp. SWIR-19 TaxID=2878390 RepID=UPI001CF5B70D|nr:nucleotidyltransferase family protein [Sulfurimonas sp. SWIR-19]UCN00485.1 nucleotidyltransferase family protein [Sulfurimonas sp. SWIR-19]